MQYSSAHFAKLRVTIAPFQNCHLKMITESILILQREEIENITKKRISGHSHEQAKDRVKEPYLPSPALFILSPKLLR